MRNKRVTFFAGFILCAALASAAPYATLSYGEGKNFTLIRNAVATEWAVSDRKVFGLEIQPGDIINTGSSTFLEIFIHPIKASVQIAENTSYRCAADETGSLSSGELYYGRVRAKVAKLSGNSSFRISSPSLVAGVRGTDFGCDVIASRKDKDPVLHRVFCFEGSVVVSAVDSSSSTPISIGGDEMVELSVSPDVSSSGADLASIKKTTVSPDVRNFWNEHPVTGVDLASVAAPVSKVRTQNGLVITDRVWPSGIDRVPRARNLTVPGFFVIALVGAGSVLCVGSAAYSQATNRAVNDSPLYIAGAVMAGSGAILGLLSSVFE